MQPIQPPCEVSCLSTSSPSLILSYNCFATHCLSTPQTHEFDVPYRCTQARAHDLETSLRTYACSRIFTACGCKLNACRIERDRCREWKEVHGRFSSPSICKLSARLNIGLEQKAAGPRARDADPHVRERSHTARARRGLDATDTRNGWKKKEGEECRNR